MLYIAYTHMCSEFQNGKTVLDGDTDLDALRDRVNLYMSSPKMVNYNRGVKHCIPDGETRSPTYRGSGGGCFYSTWLTIEILKPLDIG